MTSSIEGFCDPRFQQLRQAFENNFEQNDEVGASVCLTLNGDTLVDLWGGTTTPAADNDSTPWREDTKSVVFSCTKGATALCVHVLASRGQIDINAPVSKYWPEFAQNGKAEITVRMLLNHQSGVPAVDKPLSAQCYANWDEVIDALERQKPYWAPGYQAGYELLTFGWLNGELVRRVSGQSLGQFFKNEIAEPLGIDFWIGLPESLENQIAPMIPAPPDPENPFFARLMDQNSIQTHGLLHFGDYMTTDAGFNSRAAHAAEIGGAGGIANARALAGMYAPLANGGSHNGVTIVDEETLTLMGRTASAVEVDTMLLFPTHFGLGFMKNMDNRRQPPGRQSSAVLSDDAFGHVGAGGSIGFADPKIKMSFGYSMNRMGPGLLLNERGQSLIDAAYSALE